MLAKSTATTAQGKRRVLYLQNASGPTIFRPRGMKGFVWDYIVDLKLDVMPDFRFRPKKGLPRILTSDVFYDLRKPLEEAGHDVTSRQAQREKLGRQFKFNILKKSVIHWK